MREVPVTEIISAVSTLCIESNIHLPSSLCETIDRSLESEKDPAARGIFGDMRENLRAAGELGIPICQDTGMAVVFADIGRSVSITGGSFEDAVNAGVADGYTRGFLRKSVVRDPIRRGNTGDNTPAVIHTRIVEGDRIRLTVAPKGFGSENMSVLRMFVPTTPLAVIEDFIVGAVRTADANPCPPVVVGVGLGGDFEYCALLAKTALCRDVSVRNPDPFYADMEARLLSAINALGIGPQGMGGTITALAVNIETFPTHIASLPVAVNMGCHVTRHASVLL